MADIVCPICKQLNRDAEEYCEFCGAKLQSTRMRATRTTAYGNVTPRAWTLIFLLLLVIGGVLALIGFWIIGLPMIIAAGYLAYATGDDLANQMALRISVLLVMVSIAYINLIPENKLITIFGVTIAFMAIILMQREATVKEGKKSSPFAPGPVMYWSIVGIIFTVFWTIFNVGLVDLFTTAAIAAITGGMVASSFFWKQPINAGLKGLLTLLCFAPLLFFMIQFAFVAGGAWFGGFLDQIQHALSAEGLGISGTALDMILNPELAVQAGLKPATTREITETAGPPSVAFTASGEALPTSGCYDTSSFQVIGRVKNTGGVFIKDLTLEIKAEPMQWFQGISTPCGDNIDFASTTNSFSIKSLPIGVTSSKSRVIDKIPIPQNWKDAEGNPLADIYEAFGGETGIFPTHSCFIDIIAETGYHGLVRLPVQFIEADYARNKFEQRQLSQTIVPGTISTGPVEFSIGGFEQPVLYYDDDETHTVTLITTISNTGNGAVEEYLSAYIYVPDSLLDDGECASSSDRWECTNSNINSETECESKISDSEAEDHCKQFVNFRNNEKIGGYEQFEYDNSHELLDNDYSVCFYTDEINPNRLITTGTCTLTVTDDVMDTRNANDLRRTLIIRGDVLYTYKVSGDVSITVRDCNI